MEALRNLIEQTVACIHAEREACERLLRLSLKQQDGMARRDPARLLRASRALEAALPRLEAKVRLRQASLARLLAASGLEGSEIDLKFVHALDEVHGGGMEPALRSLAATSGQLRARNQQTHELASHSLSLVREEMHMLAGATEQGSSYDERGADSTIGASGSPGVIDGRA